MSKILYDVCQNDIKDGTSGEAATKVFTKNGGDIGSGGFETGN